MNADQREQIRQILKSLVEAQAATIALTEKAFSLFNDGHALDPLTFWKAKYAASNNVSSDTQPVADQDRLEVRYRGRTCRLGNGLPFRLIARLSRQPNTYISYEQLLDDVWGAHVSDAAVRQAVKRLRADLRRKDMADLADAIDGSQPGRYALLVVD